MELERNKEQGASVCVCVFGSWGERISIKMLVIRGIQAVVVLWKKRGGGGREGSASRWVSCVCVIEEETLCSRLAITMLACLEVGVVH